MFFFIITIYKNQNKSIHLLNTFFNWILILESPASTTHRQSHINCVHTDNHTSTVYTQTITHQLCTHRQSHINYVHTDNHTSTVLHSWKDLKVKSSHLTFKQSWHFTHCGDHLHDCIISLRGEVWANKTSLTCHFFFIDVRVSMQESERSCVSGVSILFLSTIFQLGFGTVPPVWYCFCYLLGIHVRSKGNTCNLTCHKYLLTNHFVKFFLNVLWT